MSEFGMRDFVCPETRVVSIEDPEVSFNLLVNTFHFAIRLRMICDREGKVIIEELAKRLDKGEDELWSLVRDDFVIQAKMKVDFVEKENGYSLSSDGFLGVVENYPFHKVIVNHNQ